MLAHGDWPYGAYTLVGEADITCVVSVHQTVRGSYKGKGQGIFQDIPTQKHIPCELYSSKTLVSQELGVQLSGRACYTHTHMHIYDTYMTYVYIYIYLPYIRHLNFKL